MADGPTTPGSSETECFVAFPLDGKLLKLHDGGFPIALLELGNQGWELVTTFVVSDLQYKYPTKDLRPTWSYMPSSVLQDSRPAHLRGAADFGVHYWTSHHPFVVPEPCMLEPTETPAKEDLDEYARIMHHVAQEARQDPERVKSGPHNLSVHQIDHQWLDDPARWAMTWRAYRKKVEAGRGHPDG